MNYISIYQCIIMKYIYQLQGVMKKPWNYLLEGGPLVVQASQSRFGFSEFFWSLNTFAHFMMGDLQVHLTTLHWVFSSFWPKMAWLSCPTFPIHWSCSEQPFFVSWMKKVLKGKHFADVEEMKQKNGTSTKRHQNWWVQKLFWAVGKMSHSIGVLH